MHARSKRVYDAEFPVAHVVYLQAQVDARQNVYYREADPEEEVVVQYSDHAWFNKH